MTFYEKIIIAFNNFNIDYLIVGGMAVNLYGAERTTKDLDIWVKNSEENISRFKIAMLNLGFSLQGCNQAAERLIEGQTIIIPDEDNLLKVDVLGLYSTYLSFDEAHPQKEKILLGSVVASVISLDHLIDSKIRAGRPKDLFDAKNLQELREKRLLK